MKQNQKQYLAIMYKTLCSYTEELQKILDKKTESINKLPTPEDCDISDQLYIIRNDLAMARQHLAPFVVEI